MICFNSFVILSSSIPSEPPQFIKEPEKHITAEMEKVVDIPCQARGEHMGAFDHNNVRIINKAYQKDLKRLLKQYTIYVTILKNVMEKKLS